MLNYRLNHNTAWRGCQPIGNHGAVRRNPTEKMDEKGRDLLLAKERCKVYNEQYRDTVTQRCRMSIFAKKYKVDYCGQKMAYSNAKDEPELHHARPRCEAALLFPKLDASGNPCERMMNISVCGSISWNDCRLDFNMEADRTVLRSFCLQLEDWLTNIRRKRKRLN